MPSINRRIRDQCDRFWEETAISGISNAAHAKHSPLRRTLWIASFLIFAAITLQSVYHVFDDFLQYPTTTTVSISLKNTVSNNNAYCLSWLENFRKRRILQSISYEIFQVKLPAVTVCNQNRISCGMLQEHIQNIKNGTSVEGECTETQNCFCSLVMLFDLGCLSGRCISKINYIRNLKIIYINKNRKYY